MIVILISPGGNFRIKLELLSANRKPEVWRRVKPNKRYFCRCLISGRCCVMFCLSETYDLWCLPGWKAWSIAKIMQIRPGIKKKKYMWVGIRKKCKSGIQINNKFYMQFCYFKLNLCLDQLIDILFRTASGKYVNFLFVFTTKKRMKKSWQKFKYFLKMVEANHKAYFKLK